MLRFLSAIAIGTFTSVLFVGPASAAPAPDVTLGACNSGWYVNPDETSRKPTPGSAGLKFEGNDLIHHATTGSIEGLTAGTFVASPAPDQPSFFSVEVRNGDGTGYATLRWNTTTSKWNMVTGGTSYENAVAADLVKMPEPDRSSSLVSFGLGYTNSPPGTVATVVSSMAFKGVTYNLKCAPPSPSASASASNSASPSSSVPPVVGAGLPVTGAPVPVLIAIGVGVILVGSLLIVVSRKRRVESP